MAEEKEGILKWLSKPFVWVAQNIVSFGSWVTSPIRNAIWGRDDASSNSQVAPIGQSKTSQDTSGLVQGAQQRGDNLHNVSNKTEELSVSAGEFLRTIQNAFPIQKAPEEDSVGAAGRVNPRRTSAKAAGDQAAMVTALGGHVEQLKGTEVKAGSLNQGAKDGYDTSKKLNDQVKAGNYLPDFLDFTKWGRSSKNPKVEAPRKTPAVEGKDKQVQSARGSSSRKW
ncbi:MAG: hypothetical protein WBJ81_06420 [Rickettsiales bacterium]